MNDAEVDVEHERGVLLVAVECLLLDGELKGRPENFV